jgi:phage terminase Nu1 subunit (DNA packaging protein)
LVLILRKTCTVVEVASCFRVTSQSVHQWIKGGMPVAVQGAQGRGKKTQLDLEAVGRWYFETNFQRLQLDRARTSLANEQSATQALRNAERRGDVCLTSDAAAVVNYLCASIVRQLESLPSRVVALLGSATDLEAKRAVILEEIRTIRSAVADELQRMGALDVAPSMLKKQKTAMQTLIGVRRQRE